MIYRIYFDNIKGNNVSTDVVGSVITIAFPLYVCLVLELLIDGLSLNINTNNTEMSS